VAAAFIEGDSVLYVLSKELQSRAGIELPEPSWQVRFRWDHFIKRANLDEVLTSITVVIHAATEGSYRAWVGRFREAVGLAMREENLGLRIDHQAVIHYAVDEDFDSARLATLAILNAAGLAASRTAYEDAFRYMD
jgi:hypothetical protein